MSRCLYKPPVCSVVASGQIFRYCKTPHYSMTLLMGAGKTLLTASLQGLDYYFFLHQLFCRCDCLVFCGFFKPVDVLELHWWTLEHSSLWSSAFAQLWRTPSVLALLPLAGVNGSWGWRSSREAQLPGTLRCHRSQATPGVLVFRLSRLLLTLLGLQALRLGHLSRCHARLADLMHTQKQWGR